MGHTSLWLLILLSSGWLDLLDEGLEYVGEPADEGSFWCVVESDGGGFLRRSFLGALLGVGDKISVAGEEDESNGNVREGILFLICFLFFCFCFFLMMVVLLVDLLVGCE